MQGVTTQPRHPDHATDAAPTGGQPAPEHEERAAFAEASDALQRHREPSPVWGDERDAVSIAMEWAATYTVLASDPKATARSAQA